MYVLRVYGFDGVSLWIRTKKYRNSIQGSYTFEQREKKNCVTEEPCYMPSLHWMGLHDKCL